MKVIHLNGEHVLYLPLSLKDEKIIDLICKGIVFERNLHGSNYKIELVEIKQTARTILENKIEEEPKYKYFKSPDCKSALFRVNQKTGEVTEKDNYFGRQHWLHYSKCSRFLEKEDYIECDKNGNPLKEEPQYDYYKNLKNDLIYRINKTTHKVETYNSCRKEWINSAFYRFEVEKDNELFKPVNCLESIRNGNPLKKEPQYNYYLHKRVGTLYRINKTTHKVEIYSLNEGWVDSCYIKFDVQEFATPCDEKGNLLKEEPKYNYYKKSDSKSLFREDVITGDVFEKNTGWFFLSSCREGSDWIPCDENGKLLKEEPQYDYYKNDYYTHKRVGFLYRINKTTHKVETYSNEEGWVNSCYTKFDVQEFGSPCDENGKLLKEEPQYEYYTDKDCVNLYRYRKNKLEIKHQLKWVSAPKFNINTYLLPCDEKGNLI